MKREFYLGRLGKIHGPFSEQELEKYEASGKILEFSWVWDSSEKIWLPIDPPPSTQPEAKQAMSTGQDHSSPYLVVGYDHVDMVSGKMEQLTQTGCRLNTTDEQPSPKFSQGSKIMLNICLPGSKTSVTIPAKLIHILREKSGWNYRLRWDGSEPFDELSSLRS